MTNPNRLFVTEHDNHITEERRIRDKMKTELEVLRVIFADLNQDCKDENWRMAAKEAERVRQKTSYLWILDQRLQDVVELNETFSKIQAHTDRIEETGQ